MRNLKKILPPFSAADWWTSAHVFDIVIHLVVLHILFKIFFLDVFIKMGQCISINICKYARFSLSGSFSSAVPYVLLTSNNKITNISMNLYHLIWFLYSVWSVVVVALWYMCAVVVNWEFKFFETWLLLWTSFVSSSCTDWQSCHPIRLRIGNWKANQIRSFPASRSLIAKASKDRHLFALTIKITKLDLVGTFKVKSPAERSFGLPGAFISKSRSVTPLRDCGSGCFTSWCLFLCSEEKRWRTASVR